MWRLQSSRGRQWWTFAADAGTAAERAAVAEARAEFTETRHVHSHSADRLLRLQAAAGELHGNPTGGRCPPVPEGLDGVGEALHKGLAFFATLQCGDGHWSGDYAGPMFLLPGMVIACYITKTRLGESVEGEMVRYLRNHQNADGGFGLHIEHHSTMFGTALNYVSLRLLGVGTDDPACIEARVWIAKHGGAGGVPGWGKFWLAVLGVYDWDGLDPLTPEFWLMPYALPIHPARMWCHCRVVYLPMSHLYGKRAVGEITPLVKEIREELYNVPYAQMEWAPLRGYCCDIDVYVQRPRLQRLLWGVLVLFEKMPFPGKARLRKAALDETLMQIHAEDANTNHIDIGPVNKVINFLCVWFDNPTGPEVAAHVDRLKDYLWLAEDGMKMQGYNGSQLWDTAFTSQAMLTADRELLTPFMKTLTLAHDYINISQVRVNVPDRERFYRHISKGAWPFSTVDHGWYVYQFFHSILFPSF